jgi:hypothetical protein
MRQCRRPGYIAIRLVQEIVDRPVLGENRAIQLSNNVMPSARSRNILRQVQQFDRHKAEYIQCFFDDRGSRQDAQALRI